MYKCSQVDYIPALETGHFVEEKTEMIELFCLINDFELIIDYANGSLILFCCSINVLIVSALRGK